MLAPKAGRSPRNLQATTLAQRMMGVEQKLTLATIEYDNVVPTVFELPAPIKALIK